MLQLMFSENKTINKFRREKHENLRDNCEYNTSEKLYLYLTKYLFR
jgi:hypothetical protein